MENALWKTLRMTFSHNWSEILEGRGYQWESSR